MQASRNVSKSSVQESVRGRVGGRLQYMYTVVRFALCAARRGAQGSVDAHPVWMQRHGAAVHVLRLSALEGGRCGLGHCAGGQKTRRRE